jgi:hypothetical protein
MDQFGNNLETKFKQRWETIITSLWFLKLQKKLLNKKE